MTYISRPRDYRLELTKEKQVWPMNDNRLEQNHIATRLLKVLPVLLLPTLLLITLLCGLSRSTRAGPTRKTTQNLVLNADFEQDSGQSSPAFWGNPGADPGRVGYFWSGTEYRSPVHSAGIWSTGPYTGWWGCYTFTVRAGLLYTFSGWVKTDLSATGFLSLAFYSAMSQPIAGFSSQVADLSAWTEVTGSAIAPAGAQYGRIHCTLNGTGTTWFDDIDVREIPIPLPVMNISKVAAPDPVTPAQRLVYTITYSNTGKISATQVIITETYDANVTFHFADPLPQSPSNNRWVTNTLGPHDGGFIMVAVTVTSPLIDGLILTNSVEMDWNENETDPITYVTTTTVTSRPDLAISKSDSPDPVRPGGTLYYVITYSNTGTAIARKVRITDTLPVSVSYVSASVTPTVLTDILIWEIDELIPPESDSVAVAVAVSSFLTSGLTLTNSVEIGCDETGSVTDTITTTISTPGKLYLPLILKNFDAFCNGGFETGDFACWTHGGELDQSVQCDGGNCVALLGSPDYLCRRGVPIGEAWMSQTFSVPSCPNPTLSFEYRILSNDKLTQDQWDSFDVYIDDALILRDGNTEWDQASCDRKAWDSGWIVDFSYGLSAYSGQNIELSFHNVSRADHYYNTWTYVDQVDVTCTP